MTPVYRYRFEHRGQGKPVDVLVLFMGTAAFDDEAIATAVETEIEANLTPDLTLVLVRQPSFLAAGEALRRSSTCIAARNRLERHGAVVLVGYDSRGREQVCERLGGPPPGATVAFDDFRRRAMTDIFNRRRGFVESTSTFHFANPSGRHTERFIRLSNILVRGAEIAFVAFCAMPSVPDGTAVAYIDTPALYAVVAALNEQYASFGLAPLLADNFQSYDGFGPYAFGRQPEAMALVSASSTGSLARRLAAEKGFEESRILHLLFLGRDAGRFLVVCDLAAAGDNPDGIAVLPRVEDAANCSMCAAGSFAVRLNGDQFDVAGPQPEPLLINRSHAPPGLSAQMGRFVGTGAFGVGLGAAETSQPGLFDIDEGALLGCGTFVDRLDYALRRSLPGALSHIVAVDGRSAALAEHVRRKAEGFGADARIVERARLEEIGDGRPRAVAIVATAVESGRSLLEISRELRRPAPAAPLVYIVGVAKTTGEARREALARTLCQTDNPSPHNFLAVETLVLPASRRGNAWTAELQLLIDPRTAELVPAELRGFVESRTRLLRNGGTALRRELFVPNRPGGDLKVQPGFAFWPKARSEGVHSQADVFFTMASVLQQLRANAFRSGSEAIRSNWFQQTLLAPGNFGRFNDDAIQASLLRSATPSEMNYAGAPDASLEALRLVRRSMAAADSGGGAAAEFLLAIACGRMQLVAEHRRELLLGEATDAPILRFLLEVCRRLT